MSNNKRHRTAGQRPGYRTGAKGVTNEASHDIRFRAVASKTAPGGLRIRRALPNGIPALECLIERAVWGLQSRDYEEEKLACALQNRLLAVDPHLISDGTYFVAEMEGRIVGSGGWSRHRNIVNDAEGSGAGDLLDPATEVAKVRAFYVHPDYARMGIGSLILRASEEAARGAGFRRLELISTLTGAPLYAARGWRSHERQEIPLPDGQTYPTIRMTKEVEETGHGESDRRLVA